MAPSSDLRWQLAGNDPQGALFEEVGRHEGRGEYRGMEFCTSGLDASSTRCPRLPSCPFGAANPFSILTKSTLIQSDLDLLAEAARRTQVRVNFSIGTLDDEVWRSTEPGTPHPARRVEAMARLYGAGVPCGVLIAPVLPGLADAPEQLEAVVKACVEAGARSVTPLLLHLRPGVREHYMGGLAGARPDLVADHELRYAGAYASRRSQQELSAMVGAMVARHGGRTSEPTWACAVDRKRRSPPLHPAPAHQLGLGI